MAKVLNTPGVYIVEKDAFPSSVVAVPTAVPAFIGYTEKAIRGTKELFNQPTRITSLSEYVELFGEGPDTKYAIAPDANTKYKLTVDPKTRFNMFAAMRFFYSNGGGPCYIVSVGKYDYSKGVEAGPLNDEATMSGLPTLLKEQEPTLVVIPDAVLLSKDACYSLEKAMILHCKTMMNRFALLDVYAGNTAANLPIPNDPASKNVIEDFRNGVNLGGKNMQWAAAYYPWLNTTLIQATEIDFTAINNPAELVTLLKAENLALRPDKQKVDMTSSPPATITVQNERRVLIEAELDKLSNGPGGAPASPPSGGPWDKTDPVHAEEITLLSNTLLAVSPLFKDIMKDLSKEMNVMAPAAGMAGVYSSVDNDYGVQKAPANVGMVNVVSPTVNISNEEQEDLNVPLNGLAVNAIRSFVGKGLLVWGARTLDGNSQDWKYINVRRSMIMLEQSIKNAAEAYVFDPNDANTWASVKSMIINFLTVQWRNGVLVGAVQDDAFLVDVGLGTTMTPNDILEGIMNITVKVAISRPAEFIVITFQQQQQKS